MFSPVTPPGARPPIQYPPKWDVRKGACAMAVQFAAVPMCLVLEQAAPEEKVGRHFVPLMWLIVLGSAEFAVVSRVFLERRQWLGSRYQETGFGPSQEYCKFVGFSTVLYALVIRHTLTSSTQLWVYCFGMHLGSYFCFLDNFTLLQSFGCKIVNPKAWKSLNAPEILLGLILSALLVAFFTSHTLYWLSSDADVILQVFTLYLCSFSTLALLKWSKPKHELHFHHYVNFTMIIPLTRHGHLGAVLAQSFCFGSIVEGLACWGMDPILHDPEQFGTCKATEFWTNLILLMDPSKTKYLRALRLLRVAYQNEELGKPDVVKDNLGLTRAFAQQSFRLDQTIKALESCKTLSKVAEPQDCPFTELINQRLEPFDKVAFFTVVVHGLQLGCRELAAMAPTLLNTNDASAIQLFLAGQDGSSLFECKQTVLQLKSKLSLAEQKQLFRFESRLARAFALSLAS